MIPLGVRLALLFAVGACLGSLVNWATYALAWCPRPISPWSPPPPAVPPRRWTDCLPVVGWLGLRRESALHGRGFWIRPLLLEILVGIAAAALYWWEVDQGGLVQGQLESAALISTDYLTNLYVVHLLLMAWMLAASMIDFDEKIIPDEITVTGTLLGLFLVTMGAPSVLLPQAVELANPPLPPFHESILDVHGGELLGPHGNAMWLFPVTAAAPFDWPPRWADPRNWQSLAIALGCYWLWLFAIAPRIWRGRRGAVLALWLIAARLRREFCRPPLSWLAVLGTFCILAVWAIARFGGWKTAAPWAGLMSSLVGLAAGGGIVWAVRLIGTAALKREAMGFGDVTLMMMIGTFLGWQACLIAFFLAPFAGLLIGVGQLALRRGDVIPYGPFLCLGTGAVVVAWATIWIWAQPIFAAGGLLPLVLVACLAMLGLMLAVWQTIKTAIFGRAKEDSRPDDDAPV